MQEHRPVGIPNVLTDTDADRRSIHLKHWAAPARLEVPEIVEYAIIRKIYLVVRRQQFAILGYSSGVKDVTLAIDKPDDGRNVASPADNFFELNQIGIDELRLQQQIFRGIARERQLRKRDNLRAHLTRAVDPIQNLLGVSFDVADDDINLCHRQTQLRRVFHESASLKTNATAIVTKCRRLTVEMAMLWIT